MIDWLIDCSSDGLFQLKPRLFRSIAPKKLQCIFKRFLYEQIISSRIRHGLRGEGHNLRGNLVFPPLGGYLIGVATAANYERQQNYSPIFFFFHIHCGRGDRLIYGFAYWTARGGDLVDGLEVPAQCEGFIGCDCGFSAGLLLRNPRKVKKYSIQGPQLQIQDNSIYFLPLLLLSLPLCIYHYVNQHFWSVFAESSRFFCFFNLSCLFWYMQTFMKAPKWLLGMTNTVAALSAIPVVAASFFIIKYLGHTKIFMISFILYGVRFLAYSFVYYPYLILPGEILEAFTFSLTFVTATIYRYVSAHRQHRSECTLFFSADGINFSHFFALNLTPFPPFSNSGVVVM